MPLPSANERPTGGRIASLGMGKLYDPDLSDGLENALRLLQPLADDARGLLRAACLEQSGFEAAGRRVLQILTRIEPSATQSSPLRNRP